MEDRTPAVQRHQGPNLALFDAKYWGEKYELLEPPWVLAPQWEPAVARAALQLSARGLKPPPGEQGRYLLAHDVLKTGSVRWRLLWIPAGQSAFMVGKFTTAGLPPKTKPAKELASSPPPAGRLIVCRGGRTVRVEIDPGGLPFPVLILPDGREVWPPGFKNGRE